MSDRGQRKAKASARAIALPDAAERASAGVGIGSSIEVFGPAAGLVHFTSALRCPVFIGGKNYNGTPNVVRTAPLRRTVEAMLAEEVRVLGDAYWLPLWEVPAAALAHLVRLGVLRGDRVLPPMPHPSGGNGENIAWFCGRNRKQEFSSRRASTGALLLERRDALIAFFRGTS